MTPTIRTITIRDSGERRYLLDDGAEQVFTYTTREEADAALRALAPPPPPPPKTRTITLTGRPPVKIQEDDWPVIAEGDWRDFEGQHEFQSFRKWAAWLKVRQHADGRAIVYGRYDYDTAYQGESSQMHRAGELLAAGDDIATAIERVGERLQDRSGDEHWASVIAACVADLPADEI